MTRITVICNDFDYFLRHRRPVVDSLVIEGHEVTVITGGREISETVSRRWRSIHIPIERFSFSPVLDMRMMQRCLLHFLTEKPASVHLITLKPAVFSGLAAILARWLTGHPRRILISIPGLGRLMTRSTPPERLGHRVARRLVEATMRVLSSRADVNFCFETDADRDQWLRRGVIRASNSFVVNGAGVDPVRFYPRDDRREDCTVKVLFAARLLKSKGIEAFIETARRFEHRSDVEFLIAGIADDDDPDGYPLDAVAHEPAIRFLGEVTDMPKLLRDVDLVCLPTRYGEGIPRILIEAAATAIPSLTTDLPGCRQIVKDGVNGTLIPKAGTNDMAGSMKIAIEKYLATPELLQTQGRAGLDVFLSNGYSDATVIRYFVDLLLGDDETSNANQGGERTAKAMNWKKDDTSIPSDDSGVQQRSMADVPSAPKLDVGCTRLSSAATGPVSNI